MSDSTAAAVGEKSELVGDRKSAVVPSDTKPLLDEFRNLSLLVTLTTALNNKHNLSTLELPGSKCVPSLDRERTVLHAMGAILVLKHEILACMAGGASDIVVAQDDRSLSHDSDSDEFITEDDGVKYTSDIPLLGPVEVTTVANPDQRDPPREYGHCVSVPPGKNYWNEVQKLYAEKTYCLVKSPSLPDHIATVSGYLTEYMKSNPTRRLVLSKAFYHYLTVVTWKKNNHRMNRWASIALIAELSWASSSKCDRGHGMPSERDVPLRAHVTSEFLKGLDVKPDPKLARHLIALSEDNLLGSSIAQLYVSVKFTGFDNLMNRCFQQPPVLYAEDTINEFHYLLVGTLVCYVAALRDTDLMMKCYVEVEKDWAAKETARKRRVRLSKKSKEQKREEEQKHEEEERKREEEERKHDDEERKERVGLLRESQNNVTMFARLLSAILNSDAVRCHLWVLQSVSQKGLFYFPDLMRLPDYTQFAKENNILPSYYKGKDSDEDKSKAATTDSSGNDLMEGNRQLREDGNAKLSDEAELSDDEAEPSDEEALHQHRDDMECATLHEVLLGWMKSFISHYTAKQILEHYCSERLARAGSSTIQISHVGVAGQKRQLVPWSTMKSTIKSAYTTVSEEFQDQLINILEQGIQTSGPTETNKKDRSIFHSFKSLVGGKTVERHFIMHCEAALAAFAKFGPGAPATCDPPDVAMDALRQLSACLHHKAIAVTKPCCPACLELMDVFRGLDERKFMVLGGHSTVYPVELPPWLPLNICREMVHRFRKHLRSQLKIMIDNTDSASDLRTIVEVAAAAAKHHQNLSIESESALTTASSATDASAPNIAKDSDATPLNASRIASRRRPPPAGPDLLSPG